MNEDSCWIATWSPHVVRLDVPGASRAGSQAVALLGNWRFSVCYVMTLPNGIAELRFKGLGLTPPSTQIIAVNDHDQEQVDHWADLPDDDTPGSDYNPGTRG